MNKRNFFLLSLNVGKYFFSLFHQLYKNNTIFNVTEYKIKDKLNFILWDSYDLIPDMPPVAYLH